MYVRVLEISTIDIHRVPNFSDPITLDAPSARIKRSFTLANAMHGSDRETIELQKSQLTLRI